MAAAEDDCGLVYCQRCKELFPASVLDTHEEFCRKFMRLISEGNTSPEVLQNALESGVFPPDLYLSESGSEDEDSYKDALCNICDNYFPKKYLKEHQASCAGREPEYDAGFRAFLAGKETLHLAKPKPVASEKKEEPQDAKRFQVIDTPRVKREADVRPNGFGHERANADKVPKASTAKDSFRNDKSQDFFRPKASTAKDSFRNDKSQESFRPKEPTMSDEEDKAKTLPIFDENGTFKIPYSPLLNYYINQAENEDCYKVSDDEDSETLEEFWRKAREAIDKKRWNAQIYP